MFTIAVDGVDYKVYLGGQATILNKAKKPASLARFVEGDAVRFFGAVRQTNFEEIDADTLRDLNF